MTYIFAILALALFVTIHELGHFIAGRLLGFTILEFSIGMGPRLVHFTKKGTDFSLRALPIGGSCRFYGEDLEVQDERCFSAHKPWKRAIVLVSGAFMNIVSALVFTIILLAIFGQSYTGTRVGEVTPDTPAYVAGMEVDDVISKVDGQEVTDFTRMGELIDAADSEEMTITVLRDGHEVELVLHDLYNEAEGRNLMGIFMAEERIRYGPLELLGQAFRLTTEMVGIVYESLWMLITGQAGIKEVGGPVMIVQTMGQALENFEWFMYLVALISANLGVMNLLPFPALDGGRLVFVLLEWIFGKPVVSRKTEAIVHAVGMCLLLLFIAVVSFNDISRCIAP